MSTGLSFARASHYRLIAPVLLLCALTCLLPACQSIPAPVRQTTARAESPAHTPAATGTAIATIPDPAPEDANLPISASLELFVAGKLIHTVPVESRAGRKTVSDAIFNHLIRSAAWPGDDPDTIKDRITIKVQFTKDEGYPTVYHAFLRDGKPCMQAGGGFYTQISEEAYWPLHDLAMGYDLPQALTVRSGKTTIKATAIPVDRENPGRITPRDMTDHIQFLTLALKKDSDSPSPFTPTVGGEKVYGSYGLFNEKFEELKVITPSGLEPQTYLFSGREPGRYIVMLETSLDQPGFKGTCSYFFGVIVPEGYPGE